MPAPDMSTQGAAEKTAAAVRKEHALTTYTHRRGALRVHSAGCTCGQAFDWGTREEEHSEHLSIELVKSGMDMTARTYLRALADELTGIDHNALFDQNAAEHLEGILEDVPGWLRDKAAYLTQPITGHSTEERQGANQ